MSSRSNEIYWAQVFGKSPDELTGRKVADKYADEEAAYFATLSARNAGDAWLPAESAPAQYQLSFPTQCSREMYWAKLFGVPQDEPTGEKIADHCAGDEADYLVTLPTRDAGVTWPSTDCPPPAIPIRHGQVLSQNVQ